MTHASVRIWTHEVPAADAAACETNLRDVDLPALDRIDGHLGSQLLWARADHTVRFTVISRWRAGAAGIAGTRITGTLADEGSFSWHDMIDARPVDVDIVPGHRVSANTVSAHAVAVERRSRPRAVLAPLAGLLLIAVVVAWLADGDSPAPTDQPSTPEAAVPVASPTNTGATADRSASGFVPWPEPPEDHDPHVSGRPGAGIPVGDGGHGGSLVYVNDRQRPTVVDLATGNQKELDFAETRAVDVFLVERGEVVVTDELNPDLPLSRGRAFEFQVVIDNALAGPIVRPAPTLCVSAQPDCAERAWTTGGFDDGDLMAGSIAGFPPDAIGQLIGADSWTIDDRWTTFAFSRTDVPAFRIPTPSDNAVLWSITEPR